MIRQKLFIRKLRETSGQIVVFLSLVLIIMMSLVFTLIESARADALKMKFELLAKSSVESCFALYDKALLDKYGLLLFTDAKGGGAELVKIVSDMAGKNLEDNNGLLRLGSPEIISVKYAAATDAEGAVFVKAVCDYMKDAGLMNKALDIYDSIKDETDNENDFIDDDGCVDFDKIKGSIDATNESMEAAEETSEDRDIEPDEESEEIYEDLLETFDNWKNRGILSLVCDDVDKISEVPYDMTTFPSKISDEARKRNDFDLPDIDITSSILMREYVIDAFKSYRDGGCDKPEKEYVIAGKDSDLANVSSIVKKLVGIRTALNYAFLHSGNRFYYEAEAIATGVCGLLGVPAIISAIREIILIIWSLGEGIEDVKSLMRGEKVPLIKSEEDWNRHGNHGFSYDEYLRLLLYTCDINDVAYRAMDMIQIGVQEEEPAFHMQNCIYYASFEMSSTVSGMFPFLPDKLSYSLHASPALGYGDID